MGHYSDLSRLLFLTCKQVKQKANPIEIYLILLNTNMFYYMCTQNSISILYTGIYIYEYRHQHFVWFEWNLY